MAWECHPRSTVCDRRGSVGATQNQVVVLVVRCVPDHHVMEQTTFCVQDVVSPGAYLQSPAEHDTRLYVPQPRLTLWEEVTNNVLKTRCGKVCRNCFILYMSLWHFQVSVEISVHQQRTPMGLLDDK